MSKYEKAKQFYNHSEFQKAIDILHEIINNKEINEKQDEYPIAMYYLGMSKIKLYEFEKDKALVYSAITDLATAANSCIVNKNEFFDQINANLKMCYSLI